MSKTITNSQFIINAISIHGTEFNYDKTNYINNHTKVIITCCEHGEFFQTPSAHIALKQGCPNCGIIKCIESREIKYKNKELKRITPKPFTTQEFIQKAIYKHGNYFNYSDINYINNHTKIIIICPKHGKFKQLPYHHLGGNGCSKCRYENLSLLQPKSTIQFITEANKIHKNKFDYSLTDYKQANSKVIIICKYHGQFKQTPNHHLHGTECPVCIKRISKMEIKFLDHFNIPNRQVYIGRKIVDGFDPKTNTIYEYLGDYWHGNPDKYEPMEYNKICHKTHGNLHTEIMTKFNIFKNKGYNVKYIWENDWKKFNDGLDNIPKILEYNHDQIT